MGRGRTARSQVVLVERALVDAATVVNGHLRDKSVRGGGDLSERAQFIDQSLKSWPPSVKSHLQQG
eukprot:scaffold170200_cov30-Tisochrysis_lutea.AAC.4